MPLEIKVGPPQLAIHQGFAIFVSEPDGGLGWPSDKGLYFNDTRLISSYALYANGAAWDLLNSGAPVYYGARVFLTNQVFPSEAGEVPARTLSLVISRVFEGGLTELHDVTNHAETPVTFNLELAVRSDFADVFEVKTGRMVRRGRITSTWSEVDRSLTTTYRNGAFMRGVRITADSEQPVMYANGRLTVMLHLAPRQSWQGRLRFDLMDGDTVLRAPMQCTLAPTSEQGKDLAAWRTGVTKLSTPVHSVQALFDQAVEDMAALRLPIPCGNRTVEVPAAGLPWFVALFGRDTLIASMQSMMLNPEFARGALDVLGSWQAKERDDYRDAEPGKILHELRRGELAALELIPHTPYYGTADATPLYLVLLHATWRATGDLEMVRGHLAVAEGCLRWIDEYGDRDGDGFQEYGTRSDAGYENVGWKDSGDAVVDEDGKQVHRPKTLCELQGYVYAAWRGMAEIFAALDDPRRAEALNAKADSLFTKFNDVFWNETTGFYAYCLDSSKRPVFSVASNQGHLLWSGIVPPERAVRVAKRLSRPDMWSGWGIRTLSADNPAFNPFSYQNGSVWPHDNSLIALGAMRYGLQGFACRIAGDIHHASGFLAQRQLPELYSGVQRDDTNFPVQYRGANVPQAWAAASVFALLQAVLGIEMDAPNNRLVLSPSLPEWLPELTLHDLRVGRHMFDIRFVRDDGATRFEVLKGEGSCVVRKSRLDPTAAAAA